MLPNSLYPSAAMTAAAVQLNVLIRSRPAHVATRATMCCNPSAQKLTKVIARDIACQVDNVRLFASTLCLSLSEENLKLSEA
jgi:hypothetical protein